MALSTSLPGLHLSSGNPLTLDNSLHLPQILSVRWRCGEVHLSPRARMDSPFPHLLNPPIEGFTPVQPNTEPSRPDQASGSVPSEAYQQTGLNGSRKRAASRIKSTYPRKRAIQACQKCRARRTKCNNVRPTCSACEDLGVDCSYSEGDPSRYVALSLYLHYRGRCLTLWAEVGYCFKLCDSCPDAIFRSSQFV